jgi:hypothetical protein
VRDLYAVAQLLLLMLATKTHEVLRSIKETSPAAPRPSEPKTRQGRHDAAERRRSKRSGRERGCWTYIGEEYLRAAGYDPGELPYYRVWASARGRIVIQLYRHR